jgi:AraC-like DNA-binding protein
MDGSMDLTAEERLSDSPYIERIWRSNTEEEAGGFISIANSSSGLAITKIQGKTILTVRGPEIRATPAGAPPEAEFFGIQFKPGAFMPDFPARLLMDRSDVNLPGASSRLFWLKGAAWQFPDYENVETFVDRLMRNGLLLYDPVVSDVLRGHSVGMSLRTVQRRVLQATGMTQGTIYQIERARYATLLLKQGTSILDTVALAGYFDQPHLTRALRHFIGLTPAQLVNQERTERLSFLYKTSPAYTSMIQEWNNAQEQEAAS